MTCARSCHGQHPDRRGVNLVLVLILTAVIASAMMSFLTTVGSEGRETADLVWRIRAKETGLGVAARVAAAVNQQPWEARFWGPGSVKAVLLEPGQFPFDSASKTLNGI